MFTGIPASSGCSDTWLPLTGTLLLLGAEGLWCTMPGLLPKHPRLWSEAAGCLLLLILLKSSECWRILQPQPAKCSENVYFLKQRRRSSLRGGAVACSLVGPWSCQGDFNSINCCGSSAGSQSGVGVSPGQSQGPICPSSGDPRECWASTLPWGRGICPVTPAALRILGEQADVTPRLVRSLWERTGL